MNFLCGATNLSMTHLQGLFGLSRGKFLRKVFGKGIALEARTGIEPVWTDLQSAA